MQSVGALTSRAVIAVLFMVPLIVVEALLGVLFIVGPIIGAFSWWAIVLLWPLGVGGGATLLLAAANHTIVPWACVHRVRLRLHEEATAQHAIDGRRVRLDSARMVIRSAGNPQFPTFDVGTRKTAVTYLDTADADQLPARSERWLAPLTATPPRVYTQSGRITAAAARLVTVLPLLVGLPIAGGVAFVVAVSSLPD